MSEVNIDATNAMRQAGMTAEHYLNAAYKVLMENGYDNWTVRDAIELAKVMATDFNTCMMCMKLQEIRDGINAITDQM